jgi:hypothetical protein
MQILNSDKGQSTSQGVVDPLVSFRFLNGDRLRSDDVLVLGF